MMTQSEDRRVQRTRKLLQDALMALILEKSYEAVTVQDIIDRANVGRSTFYAHFLDKQQLLLSGFEQVRMFLAQQPPETVGAERRGLRFSLAMFKHACSYREVYRALVGKQSGAVVRKHMQQLLADLVCDELDALAPHAVSPRIPQEIIVQYIVGAFMGLLMWCVDHETPNTAAEMNAMFEQLTLPGVLAGLGRPEGGACHCT